MRPSRGRYEEKAGLKRRGQGGYETGRRALPLPNPRCPLTAACAQAPPPNRSPARGGTQSSVGLDTFLWGLAAYQGKTRSGGSRQARKGQGGACGISQCSPQGHLQLLEPSGSGALRRIMSALLLADPTDDSCVSDPSCTLSLFYPHGFPGGPVVRTPCFHCRGRGFVPAWETKISHPAAWLGERKNALSPKCRWGT